LSDTTNTIFFIDEALAVDDIEFRQKCPDTFESYKGQKAMVLVTHDLGLLTQFCSRAIWLSQGLVIASGEPVDIANQYRALVDVRGDGVMESGACYL
jgi:ABC-type polysaccharide/polyol phosphate transport system ATPase subunit